MTNHHEKDHTVQKMTLHFEKKGETGVTMEVVFSRFCIILPVDAEFIQHLPHYQIILCLKYLVLTSQLSDHKII